MILNNDVPQSQMILLWLLKIPALLIILMLLAFLMFMFNIMKLRFGEDSDGNAKCVQVVFKNPIPGSILATFYTIMTERASFIK